MKNTRIRKGAATAASMALLIALAACTSPAQNVDPAQSSAQSKPSQSAPAKPKVDADQGQSTGSVKKEDKKDSSKPSTGVTNTTPAPQGTPSYSATGENRVSQPTRAANTVVSGSTTTVNNGDSGAAVATPAPWTPPATNGGGSGATPVAPIVDNTPATPTPEEILALAQARLSAAEVNLAAKNSELDKLAEKLARLVTEKGVTADAVAQARAALDSAKAEQAQAASRVNDARAAKDEAQKNYDLVMAGVSAFAKNLSAARAEASTAAAAKLAAEDALAKARAASESAAAANTAAQDKLAQATALRDQTKAAAAAAQSKSTASAARAAEAEAVAAARAYAAANADQIVKQAEAKMSEVGIHWHKLSVEQQEQVIAGIVAEKINAYRTANGLEPLAFVGTLNQIAYNWSTWQVENLPRLGITHDRPEGDNTGRDWNIDNLDGVSVSPGGENVAARSYILDTRSADRAWDRSILAAADGFFEQWADSPYHNFAMVSPYSDIAGIGVKIDKGVAKATFIHAQAQSDDDRFSSGAILSTNTGYSKSTVDSTDTGSIRTLPPEYEGTIGPRDSAKRINTAESRDWVDAETLPGLTLAQVQREIDQAKAAKAEADRALESARADAQAAKAEASRDKADAIETQAAANSAATALTTAQSEANAAKATAVDARTKLTAAESAAEFAAEKDAQAAQKLAEIEAQVDPQEAAKVAEVTEALDSAKSELAAVEADKAEVDAVVAEKQSAYDSAVAADNTAAANVAAAEAEKAQAEQAVESAKGEVDKAQGEVDKAQANVPAAEETAPVVLDENAVAGEGQ